MPPPVILYWTDAANADLPPQAPSYFRPETYSLSPFANVKDDTQFSGYPQQRRHSSSYDFTAKASYILQPGQYFDFYAVLRSMLHNGLRWFLCELPSEEGYKVYLVRLSAPTTATPLGGGGWRLDVQYDVRDAYIPGAGFGGVTLAIGWYMPYGEYGDGVSLAHSNAGTAGAFSGFSQIYAGIIGYSGGTVVWSGEGALSPAIEYPISGRQDIVRLSNFFYPGIFTLTATVDGQPTGEPIEISRGFGSYAEYAWGPASAIEDPTYRRFWRVNIAYSDYGSGAYSFQTGELALYDGATNILEGLIPDVSYVGLGGSGLGGTLSNLTDGILTSGPLTFDYSAGSVSQQIILTFDLGSPQRATSIGMSRFTTDNGPSEINVLASSNGSSFVQVASPSIYWAFGSGSDYQMFTSPF